MPTSILARQCQLDHLIVFIQFQLKRGLSFPLESLYFIMGKKVKKCQKTCARHSFCLKPVHYSAVFSRDLAASFCPTSDVVPSITPKFNNDKRQFTVSFYLPSDEQKLSRNEQQYKDEHEKYKMDHIAEKSNIYQAKPKSKYSYCNVCKDDYDDYLQHIKSFEHKKKIKNNQFSFYIDQMCEEISRSTQRDQQIAQDDVSIENNERINNIVLSSSALFAQKPQLKKETNLSLCSQQKQKITAFNSYKSFHAFSEFNSQKSLIHGDQHEIVMNNLPFSPFKRYSQVTEGVRIVSNIKPIILLGGQPDLKF